MTRNRALAVLVTVATFACTTKDNTTTNTIPANPDPTTIFDGTYTLQGFIADATNGARIGDAQLFLVQGTDIRTPTRYNSAATDPLQGEYAFSGIPLDWVAGNKTYKLVATRTGYQRFEADISDAALKQFNQLPARLDGTYNIIGNVYMFQVGQSAPTYRVTVLYNGRPVPNATVVLDPSPRDNDSLYNWVQPHTLVSNGGGYAPSLTATTDASGVATFPGANLPLGAAYQIQVYPVVFTDQSGTSYQLSRKDNGGAFIVGLGDVTPVVDMSDLILDPLWVVSVSNRPLGTINPAGTFSVTFNAPVTIRNQNGFGCSATSASVVFGTTLATASLSADGKTLLLTPAWTTAPGESNGVTVTFANQNTAAAPPTIGWVEPVDYPGYRYYLFGDAIPGGGHRLTYVSGYNANGQAQASFLDPNVVMRAP